MNTHVFLPMGQAITYKCMGIEINPVTVHLVTKKVISEEILESKTFWKNTQLESSGLTLGH